MSSLNQIRDFTWLNFFFFLGTINPLGKNQMNGGLTMITTGTPPVGLGQGVAAKVHTTPSQSSIDEVTTSERESRDVIEKTIDWLVRTIDSLAV